MKTNNIKLLFYQINNDASYLYFIREMKKISKISARHYYIQDIKDVWHKMSTRLGIMGGFLVIQLQPKDI